ncbi:MAG: hypothetical protein VXW87_03790 [Pseudomonadota bacterium]|nr:hypothetical protein [Pseudomonadota bacterium]
MNTRILQTALILSAPLAFASFSIGGGVANSFKTFGDCDVSSSTAGDSYSKAFIASPKGGDAKCAHNGTMGLAVSIGYGFKNMQVSLDLYAPSNDAATLGGLGVKRSGGNTSAANNASSATRVNLEEKANYGLSLGYQFTDSLALGASFTSVGLEFAEDKTSPAATEKNDEGVNVFSGFATVTSSIKDTLTAYATVRVGQGEIEKKTGTLFSESALPIVSRDVIFGIAYSRGGEDEDYRS